MDSTTTSSNDNTVDLISCFEQQLATKHEMENHTVVSGCVTTFPSNTTGWMKSEKNLPHQNQCSAAFFRRNIHRVGERTS